MKKIVSLAVLLFSMSVLIAQNAEGGGVLSSVAISAVVGICLCVIGFGFSMFAWRKEGKEPLPEIKQKRADKMGCVGLVIGALGILCLIPLLFVLQNMLIMAIAAVVMIIVGYVIYRIVK